MIEIEQLCRVICKAEGIDPDKIGYGLGNLMPAGEKYPLWKAKIKTAEAVIDYIDNKPPAINYEVYVDITKE